MGLFQIIICESREQFMGWSTKWHSTYKLAKSIPEVFEVLPSQCWLLRHLAHAQHWPTSSPPSDIHYPFFTTYFILSFLKTWLKFPLSPFILLSLSYLACSNKSNKTQADIFLGNDYDFLASNVISSSS